MEDLNIQLVRPPITIRADGSCAGEWALAFDILLGCLGMRVNSACGFIFHVCIFLRIVSRTVKNYERRNGRVLTRRFVVCDASLTGSMPWSALGAEPAENQFAFAKHAFPKGTRSRFGHLVPSDILNVSAAIADEVVMPHAFRVEPGGAALDGHFAH
jgi:hypothetical protein